MVMAVKSRTDMRQEVAQKRLPDLIDKLQEGSMILTERTLDLLYKEVRAATKNRPPMNRRSADKRLRVLSEDVLPSRQQVLENLRDPLMLTRSEIIRHFQVLETLARSSAKA